MYSFTKELERRKLLVRLNRQDAKAERSAKNSLRSLARPERSRRGALAVKLKIMLTSRIVSIGLIILFISCGVSPELANKRLSLGPFINTDQVRTDGFYHWTKPNSSHQMNDEVGRFHVNLMFLYNDGTSYTSGFSTDDTSNFYLKKVVESSARTWAGESRNGWGEYFIKDNQILMETFSHKSKGFRNLGIVKETGIVENKSRITVKTKHCPGCGYNEKMELYVPEQRYVFTEFHIKPDSSKAFFRMTK